MRIIVYRVHVLLLETEESWPARVFLTEMLSPVELAEGPAIRAFIHTNVCMMCIICIYKCVVLYTATLSSSP